MIVPIPQKKFLMFLYHTVPFEGSLKSIFVFLFYFCHYNFSGFFYEVRYTRHRRTSR